MESPVATAHRGFPAKVPENTVPSILAALTAGADEVEVDVRLTLDGQPVVIHDPTVDRTTNGSGNVGKLRLCELQTLDAGNGARIPTLMEVLELFEGLWSNGSPAGFQIELKGPRTEHRAIELLRGHRFLNKLMLTSFSASRIRAIRRAFPALRTGLIVSRLVPDPIRAARSAKANAVLFRYDLATARRIEAVHREGMEARVWTVDNLAIVPGLVKLGVDGITSNDVAGLRDALARCNR